jgi:hypothetical protein
VRDGKGVQAVVVAVLRCVVKVTEREREREVEVGGRLFIAARQGNKLLGGVGGK